MLSHRSLTGGLFVFLLLGSVGCARQLRAPPTRSSVQGVALTVSERAGATDFFTQALGFARRGETVPDEPDHCFGSPGAVLTTLSAGAEQVTLLDFDTEARPFPQPSRSNDLWFQHLAIVVDD